MKVPTLIMAGGRGSRMGLPTEKPMLLFLGKPLIDWVVEAVLAAKKISEFYIITSSNTAKTEKYCQSKGWKTLHTGAKGYHDDLKQAVAKLGWMGPVLSMPSDVPGITSTTLDGVITKFEGCGKDFLAVFVPIEKRQALGLSISSTDEYKGIWYAVSGINIINGKQTLGNDKIETAAIITEEIEVVLNVNTTNDLQIAQNIMRKTKEH
jgi:adenosylcobinamide-phosphate guanylyltransferase